LTQDVFVASFNADGSLMWPVEVLHGQVGATGLSSYSMDIGLDGTIVIAGYFYGSADFDPTDGVDLRQAAGTPDFFVTTLTGQGGYVRTRTLTSDYIGGAVAISSRGHVYLAGTFNNPRDFDPGSGVDIKTPSGRDVFVWRLDNLGN